MENEEKQCAWCGDEGEFQLRCSVCEEVFYCSKDHKRLHWAEHYSECKSYKVKHSTYAGQYLVASRSLTPGTLILREEPMVTGPLGTSSPMCLACHAPILKENFFKCPDCQWPMCSMECAAADQHDDECAVLEEDRNLCGVPRSTQETPRYDLIILLRCLLLKKTKPKLWKLLLSMATHGSELKEREDPYQMAAVRYFSEICVVDCDVDTIHHVRGVILANALEIRGPKGGRIRTIYPNIRFLNHSCLPNVHLASDPYGTMEVRAAVTIDKGQELYITYTGADAPLWERQTCLMNSHFFQCKCERCEDPSELGTMFSSPRCPVCPRVIMTPSFAEGEVLWTCSKCGSKNSVEEIVQEINEWLFRLEMNELFGTGTPLKISHALAVIEQHFHRKHYFYLRAAQAALQKIHYDESYSALQLKKYVWERILDIFDVLEPGLTRRRGLTLLELGKTYENLAKEEFIEEGVISSYQLENFLREARSFYKEGWNALRLEPKGTRENELSNATLYKIYKIVDALGDE